MPFSESCWQVTQAGAIQTGRCNPSAHTNGGRKGWPLPAPLLQGRTGTLSWPASLHQASHTGLVSTDTSQCSKGTFKASGNGVRTVPAL